uniref:hypothetical protein n=1 Tax=Staphylococcus aureus TaxID=1280 RepID=UPI00301B735A
MTEPTPDYSAITPLRLGEPRPFWMPMLVEHCDERAKPAGIRFDLQVLDVGRRQWRELMLELDEISADKNLTDEELEEAVAELLLRVVVDWRHVQGGEGQSLPFSPEAFRQLLN